MRAFRIGIGMAGLATAMTVAVLPAGPAGPAAAAAPGPEVDYVVLYADAEQGAAARSAIRAAGGEVLRENTRIGSALVRADRADFTSAVRRTGKVAGAAPNRPIGYSPGGPARSLVERLTPAERAAALLTARDRPAAPANTPGDEEPLAHLQWDMAMIGATASGSHGLERGDRRVRVGVIDTGIDGSHPDIAPNFDAEASRNFTVDIPEVDGPCEVEDCIDPPDVDNNGHGTHVASTIGSPMNGLGIAGVAPDVTLVNLRAGQDSGFFFLQPTVDALTYAGDIGIDIVNMSFYVDPWLYNCTANPADSPEAQAEQRTIIEAVQRAVTYAIERGVTPFGALGNESTDLGDPRHDSTSPDYPRGIAYDREVDNSCITVPAETTGVISVSSLGPSGRKASYSNYGTEQTDLSAPGGDAFDTPDNRVDPQAMILGAYPEHLARLEGAIDANGEPKHPFVVKDCLGEVCAYYQYLQGTSMAAPHAAGVAALAVSRFGTPGGGGGGPSDLTVGLKPSLTFMALWLSADKRPCPSPPAYTYTVEGATSRSVFTHTCEQALTHNGFYGKGVVSASGVAALPSLAGRPPATTDPTPPIESQEAGETAPPPPARNR